MDARETKIERELLLRIRDTSGKVDWTRKLDDFPARSGGLEDRPGFATGARWWVDHPPCVTEKMAVVIDKIREQAGR